MIASEKFNRLPYIFVAVLLVFNIFMLTSFMGEKTTDQIFDENINKIVEIKVSNGEVNGFATGFFVDKKGTILTNKHVVIDSTTGKAYGKIEVSIATSEEVWPATVVRVSETDDLALIKIDYISKSYFKLAGSVFDGETIYTIGNPSGFGFSFISGVVSAKSRNVNYNGVTINCMQASFVINEGNSGGPVFNEDGKLVGIISFRLKDNKNEIIDGCTFVLPIQTVENFLKG